MTFEIEGGHYMARGKVVAVREVRIDDGFEVVWDLEAREVGAWSPEAGYLASCPEGEALRGAVEEAADAFLADRESFQAGKAQFLADCAGGAS